MRSMPSTCIEPTGRLASATVSGLNTGKSVSPTGVVRLARVLGAISRAFPQVRA